MRNGLLISSVFLSDIIVLTSSGLFCKVSQIFFNSFLMYSADLIWDT